jgi:hypothetical protein
MDRLSSLRHIIVLLTLLALVAGSSSAVAGPVFSEPAAWNQPVTATGGGWWTTGDGGVTITGKPNGDYPALANLQTGYCNPFGPATQIVGASMTRVRWHTNANDMHVYTRFIAPNGNDLGIGGGLTSLRSTRRYLYNYAPEGINLELQKNALTADAYTFPGGQCVFGGVLFNGAGSDGVVDTPGFTPLVTNRLDTVQVEDLQGPAVGGASTWPTWITGNEAPIEWDSSDNLYRRGTTGARVASAGQVDIGDPPNGRHGAWVPVGGLPDGAHAICAYRTAPAWGEAQACATFRLDRTNPAPPAVTLSPDTDGAWGNRPVTVETAPTADGSGSGWDRNQFSVDGADWTDSHTSLTIGGDGDHTVVARAVDKAGRVSAPSSPRPVRIDTTAPEITRAGVGGTTGVLSWSMTDAVGFGACEAVVAVSGPGTGGALATVFEQAGGTLPAAPAVQLPVSAMPNGDYQASLRVCDLSGNVAQVTVPFTWTGNPDGGLTGAAARFVATRVRSPGSTRTKSFFGLTIPVVRRGYNAGFTLSGRLQRPDGSALTGAPIELRDAAGRYAAGARTDARGGFTVSARATIGGAWTVNPVGSSLRQAVAWLEVRPVLRARMTMTQRSRVLVARGRFAPAGGAAGKAIQLQWLDSGTRRWRPILDGRIAPDGAFRLAYVFRRPGRYRVSVRVVVPADRGWPYLAAGSRPATVRVG